MTARLFFTSFFFCVLSFKIGFAQPITLHPANPHYFLFNDTPTVLVGSTEHYGSIINKRFDYITYLETVAAAGLNFTRIFSGSYIEQPGSFGIKENTLSPGDNNLLAPWARSTVPGYINGGNKFDLDKWDEAYFQRLRAFVDSAATRGIIVEYTFFSSYYGGWEISPMCHRNTVTRVDTVSPLNVSTLNNGNLLEYQEALVRKVVQELNGYDNIIFEVQNEPYADLPDSIARIHDYFSPDDFQPASLSWKNRVDIASNESFKWQSHIASVIISEEKSLKKKHLIAQNVGNFAYPISDVAPGISILNFHYALPQVISDNRHYKLPINFDETGFAGSNGEVYRRQAWRFFMAGGAAINHLDYSFSTGHERGDGVNNAPGAGTKALRHQLSILRSFFNRFGFIEMSSDHDVIQGAGGMRWSALSSPGNTYAVFIEANGSKKFSVNVPKGSYKTEWIDTRTGNTIRSENLRSDGKQLFISSPEIDGDIALLITSVNSVAEGLKVSDNSRFLVHSDGSPFFYLGDTGWELFHQLDLNEARTYLSNRAGKGFNVIQCVVLGEMNGLTQPNANGDLPFSDLDPSKPNEKYFKHVDDIVNLGTDMGLYMAMLPTWGAWVMKEQHPLFKPVQLFNARSAYSYGKFIGNRYKNNSRIIWMLGGDRDATGYEEVWEAMAKGLRDGDGGSHLITYHPRGQMSSSAFWQDKPWLDFNLIQSGHASRNVNSYDFIEHDYNLKPVKPTFDGETNYEDHPISFHPSNGWFTDYDVRVSSYYSVFAGGFGITYGCHNIWQMNDGRQPVAYSRHTWMESLDLAGAFQMRHLKNLMESRPFITRIPDQSLLLPTQKQLVPFEGKGSQHMQATRDGTPGNNDATYLMAYMSVGRSVNLKTAVIPGKRIRAWWYDPREGAAIPIGEFDNAGTFEPGWNSLPWHNGAGPDWVLVIDDASKGYPPPGISIYPASR